MLAGGEDHARRHGWLLAKRPHKLHNPPGDGVRSLAVYNPIHHMELPELFFRASF